MDFLHLQEDVGGGLHHGLKATVVIGKPAHSLLGRKLANAAKAAAFATPGQQNNAVTRQRKINFSQVATFWRKIRSTSTFVYHLQEAGSS